MQTGILFSAFKCIEVLITNRSTLVFSEAVKDSTLSGIPYVYQTSLTRLMGLGF